MNQFSYLHNEAVCICVNQVIYLLNEMAVFENHIRYIYITYIFCLSPPGTYCPSGSSTPQPCPLGQYCETYGLSTPTADCYEGYFCNGSSYSPDPQTCSPGHYCPQGTSLEIPCAPGTFSGLYFLFVDLFYHHYWLCFSLCPNYNFQPKSLGESCIIVCQIKMENETLSYCITPFQSVWKI